MTGMRATGCELSSGLVLTFRNDNGETFESKLAHWDRSCNCCFWMECERWASVCFGEFLASIGSFSSSWDVILSSGKVNGYSAGNWLATNGYQACGCNNRLVSSGKTSYHVYLYTFYVWWELLVDCDLRVYEVWYIQNKNEPGNLQSPKKPIVLMVYPPLPSPKI